MDNNINYIIDHLTLIDDTLLTMVLNYNHKAAELILNTLLNKQIHVKEVHTQEYLHSPLVGGRSIRMDINIKDTLGNKYIIEIQRDLSQAMPKRARFYLSMLDSTMLKQKMGFDELKASFIIFITEKDYFKQGKPFYDIRRYDKENRLEFNDDSHILYVNGEYEKEDKIGYLMHDFKCGHLNDFHYNVLKESVAYFKYGEGKKTMCKLVEDYAKEYAKEYAEELIEKNSYLEEQLNKKNKENNELAIMSSIKTGLAFNASKEMIINQIKLLFSLNNEQALNAYNKYSCL